LPSLGNAAFQTIMKTTRRELGDQGEDLAAQALKKQGYKIIERNYLTPIGEVDLIAKQKGVLVFIEVKTRKSQRFGSPAEAVHPAKQAKLRRLADYFAAVRGAGAFPHHKCNAPWVSAVIEADGSVRPCFFHQAYGNIHDAPFDEVLNAPRAMAFRKGLKVRKNPVCRQCVCFLYLRPGDLKKIE